MKLRQVPLVREHPQLPVDHRHPGVGANILHRLAEFLFPAGGGVQLSDEIGRLPHLGQSDAQLPRNGGVGLPAQLVQMPRADGPRHGGVPRQAVQLQGQTFPQVPRPDACRVQALERLYRLLQQRFRHPRRREAL